MAISILLNGESREMPAPMTVAGLIDLLGLAGKRLAVEVNENIVPRSAHPTTVLQQGDRVEIVHAIGGG